MNDNFVDNLSRGENWLRVLMVVVYAFIFWLALWVTCLVVVLNLLVLLFTGERNAQLTEFGGKVADYLRSVVRYATQATENKPFPFEDQATDAAPPAKPAATKSEPAATATQVPAADATGQPAAKSAAKKKKKAASRKKKTVKKVKPDDSAAD